MSVIDQGVLIVIVVFALVVVFCLAIYLATAYYERRLQRYRAQAAAAVNRRRQRLEGSVVV